MLSGETVLCFAPDPWSGLWRNRHQIMTRLARRNVVIYVEPRVYLGQALRDVRAGRIRWADLGKNRLVRDRENLYIYRDPVYAPYSGRLSGGPLTAAIRRTALRRALAGLGGNAPILWLLRPFHADQIGLYREKLVVYHVTDEYSGFPTVTDKAAFQASEEALLRRADVVLVTSPALLQAKGGFNDRTHLVPNAVDYAGFQTALAGDNTGSKVAEQLSSIARPRIGYVGALNEKIDFDLLAAIASQHRDWQFVLVGALDLTGDPHKADALAALANVHWLGRVPVEQVPHAIAGMDVCLLPYARNSWTAAIDSLKLYEYFACGKPVVATDIPAAHAPFAGGLVRIADTAERLAEQIQAALDAEPGDDGSARKAAAAMNTWDHRVAQIEAILEATLARPRKEHTPSI